MQDQHPALSTQLETSTAILDRQGNILSVNETWRQFAELNNMRHPAHGVGLNYIEVCIAFGAEAPLIKELKDLLSGARTTMSRWYKCDVGPDTRNWYIMIGIARPDSIILSHIDLGPMLDEKTREALDLERPDLAFTTYAR